MASWVVQLWRKKSKTWRFVLCC